MLTQPLPVYVSKAVELYETTLVRHGIMLIGGSLSGESVSSNNAVQNLLTLLDCYSNIIRSPFEKVVDADEVVKIDPLDQMSFFSQFSSVDTIPYFEDDSQTETVFESNYFRLVLQGNM